MRTPGRRLRGGAAGVLVLLPAALQAATTLFLSSEVGDFVGGARQYAYSSADGAFMLSGSRQALDIWFSGNADGRWSLWFAAPEGAPLAPGEYVVSPSYGGTDQGAMSVSGQGRSCGSDASGRFVVREVTFDAAGRPASVAIDFEQRCHAGAALFGAVRVGSGAGACAGASDGTPCDDLDACTAADACRAGSCEGTEAVRCSPDAPCIDARCDPATGACRTAHGSDDVSCDDGEAGSSGVCRAGVCVQCPPFSLRACTDGNLCTTDDRCSAGVCQGTAVDCDDANPCTDDRCEPAQGCVHDVVAGCYVLRVQASVSASASGEVQGREVDCPTVRCQQASEGLLFLPGDGTYRAPAGETTCVDRGVVIPDEVGILRRARGGRLRLRPGNRAELRRALRRCRGRRLAIGERSWIRLSEDARELTGLSRAHLTIFDVVPIHVQIMTRLRGRLGAAPDPPVRRPKLPVCSAKPRLVCHVR